MVNLRERQHGRGVVILGPVHSGKKSRLETDLSAAKGRIWQTNGDKDNILIFTHPDEQINPMYEILNEFGIRTDNPDDIALRIKPETEAVYIVGAHRFEDNRVVELYKELISSNRIVVASLINSDWEARPINHTAEILALSDEFIQTTSPCSVRGCNNIATRSQFISDSEPGEARCVPHHTYEGRPDVKHHLSGNHPRFNPYLSGMFTKKSTRMGQPRKNCVERGIDYAAFKILQDIRYDEVGKEHRLFGMGKISLHAGWEEDDATLVRGMDDVFAYLSASTGIPELDAKLRQQCIKELFFDELPWFPGRKISPDSDERRPVSDDIRELIYSGYTIHATGLLRYYTLEPIVESGRLIALADSVTVGNSYCSFCGGSATDSQRMTYVDGVHVPSWFNEDRLRIGGDGRTSEEDDMYLAVCKLCHKKGPDYPEPVFDLPPFSKTFC